MILEADCVVLGLAQMKYDWFLQPQQLIDLDVFDQASRGHLTGSMRLLRLLISLKKR